MADGDVCVCMTISELLYIHEEGGIIEKVVAWVQ